MNTINRFFKTAANDLDFLNKKNKNHGFSLIEMIVVVTIMAVMVVVLAPSLLTYNERSRAEKDNASMDELVNAVQLALADSEVYDEVLRFSTVDNVSCYVDTNSESNYSRIVTKANPDGIDQYTFLSDARTLDETPYFAAGNMRGVTLTFAPDKGSNGSTFDLKQGVVNQYIQVSNNQRIGAMPKLYNAVRSTIGDTIVSDSQTYRNSEYTIFVRLGTTGGNDASQQDAIQAYGQWSGTNLPAQVSYQIVSDRTVGDTGNTIVDIDDNKWNETNGSKITLKPGDLNGGGAFTPGTSTGNETDKQNGSNNDQEEIVLEAGLYDENDQLIVDWDTCGINPSINYTYKNYKTSTTSGYYVLNNVYSDTRKIVLPNNLKIVGDYLFRDCLDLIYVQIPNEMEQIGQAAFFNCKKLKHINMPEGIKVIGDSSFKFTAIEEIVFPDSVITIGNGAFDRCLELKKVTLGNGITSVEESVFYGCTALEAINIPNNVESIDFQAFYDCERLENIILPSNLKSIGTYAFKNCKSLKEIVIPYSVDYINSEAFANCTGLTSVRFEKTVGWRLADNQGSPTMNVDSSYLENNALYCLTSAYCYKFWTSW